MKHAIGTVLLLAGVGLLVYALVVKVQWNEGAGERARIAWDAVNSRGAVTTDDLEIENQRVQDQILEAQGKRNDGIALQKAEMKRLADQNLAEAADEAEAAAPSEDLAGELVGLFAGMLLLILGAVLQIGPKAREPVTI